MQSKCADRCAEQRCSSNVQSKCAERWAEQSAKQCAEPMCNARVQNNVQGNVQSNVHGKYASQVRKAIRSLARSSCSQGPMCQRRSRLCRSAATIRVVPIRSMPSRSVSIRAVPIRAVLSRVPRRPAHSAIGVDDCRICIVSEQLSSSFVQFAPVRSCCRLMLHCIVVPFVRIVCRPRPYARLQLRRSALFAPPRRATIVASLSCAVRARMCGCSFVEVLVRTSSSRDYCRLVIVCSPRPCAAAASSKCSFALPRRATTVASFRMRAVRASYDSVYIPISCRFRFVRISFSVPSFLAASLLAQRSLALPPPPSLSIVPSVSSRRSRGPRWLLV